VAAQVVASRAVLSSTELVNVLVCEVNMYRFGFVEFYLPFASKRHKNGFQAPPLLKIH
jgi:hypothetical protein